MHLEEIEIFTNIIALFRLCTKQIDWCNLLSEMVQFVVDLCGNKSQYNIKEGSRENGKMRLCVSGCS